MKRGRQNPTCYMCDAPSTSKDHAPPLCLFPEAPEHRKSLVKVWSCDEHNSGKSDDDELLRWVLATNGRNELALRVLNEGILPRLETDPHIRDTFQPDARFGVRDGKIVRGSWAVDPKRFISSITAIVRALHYHHTYYAEKLSGDMKVQWAALKDRDLAAASINLSDEDYAEFTKLLPDQPYLPIGANPRVFQYGFDQHSDPVNDICALRFYEGETIYVHWKKLPAQVWSTTLEIVADYFKEFPQMQLPSLIGIHESERVELLRQCAARSRRLAEIVRQARHKQDIAAYGLAKMLREENYRNKLRLLVEPAIGPITAH